MINRDFADVTATMVGLCHAMRGAAVAGGKNAAVQAARQAIRCSRSKTRASLDPAERRSTSPRSSRLGLHEVNETCTIIREAVLCDEVQISFGA